MRTSTALALLLILNSQFLRCSWYLRCWGFMTSSVDVSVTHCKHFQVISKTCRFKSLLNFSMCPLSLICVLFSLRGSSVSCRCVSKPPEMMTSLIMWKSQRAASCLILCVTVWWHGHLSSWSSSKQTYREVRVEWAPGHRNALLYLAGLCGLKTLVTVVCTFHAVVGMCGLYFQSIFPKSTFLLFVVTPISFLIIDDWCMLRQTTVPWMYDYFNLWLLSLINILIETAFQIGNKPLL